MNEYDESCSWKNMAKLSMILGNFGSKFKELDIIESPIHSFIHQIKIFPLYGFWAQISSTDLHYRLPNSHWEQSRCVHLTNECVYDGPEKLRSQNTFNLYFLHKRNDQWKTMKPKFWATLKLIVFTLHNWRLKSSATAEIRIYRDTIIASIYSFQTTEQRKRERKKKLWQNTLRAAFFNFFFSSSTSASNDVFTFIAPNSEQSCSWYRISSSSE